MLLGNGNECLRQGNSRFLIMLHSVSTVDPLSCLLANGDPVDLFEGFWIVVKLRKVSVFLFFLTAFKVKYFDMSA